MLTAELARMQVPLNSADAERLRRQQECDEEDETDRALDVRF